MCNNYTFQEFTAFERFFEDLNAFLDAVIFNLLVGNNDAHGKNFSFLYSQGQIRLAPLYDVLSTAYYPELSHNLAMKIGGEYDARKLKMQNIERMAEESGLAKGSVKRRVLEVTERVIRIPQSRAKKRAKGPEAYQPGVKPQVWVKERDQGCKPGA